MSATRAAVYGGDSRTSTSSPNPSTKEDTMNRWAAMARDHWQTHQPTQYAQIPDPEEHFTRLGQHISDEITHLQMALAGDDIPGEGFLGKVRRLQTARTMATEQILRECLPAAEATDHDHPDTDRAASSAPADADDASGRSQYS